MEIHFILPSKLPVLSKTLLSYFTPPALSLRQCFKYFMSTRRFKKCRDNDERAEWFFTLPAFLQTREALLFFLHEVYFRPGAPYAYTLPFQAPFDPWLVVYSNRLLPAPSLLHFVYHHLPTSAFRACQAVWALLKVGEWEYAKVILECGADPAAASPYALNRNYIYWHAGKDTVAPHLKRRAENWPTEQVAKRRRCSCGHDCKAQAPGRAQAEIMALFTSKRRRLRNGATNRFNAPAASRLQTLSAAAPTSWKLSLQDFMLPQNGTVGRIPTPYANVGRKLTSYSTAKYRGNLAAAFVDEYLERLFEKFAQLYTPPERASIL